MTTVEAALRRPAEALEAFKAAQIERTRGAMDAVRGRAAEARQRARDRALAQFDRGRSVAATRLEGLAGALRTMDRRHAARSRRKAAMIAGGSSVALLAAVGLGVALGMTLSKRLKRKEQLRERLAAPAAPPPQDADEVLTTPAAF